MGKNSLGDMMKKISQDAQLTRVYVEVLKAANITQQYFQIHKSFHSRYRDYVINRIRFSFRSGSKYFKAQNSQRDAVVRPGIQENTIRNGLKFIILLFPNKELRLLLHSLLEFRVCF